MDSSTFEVTPRSRMPLQSRIAPAWLSRVILYLGFAGTGVGMALPGSVLPAILTRLSLRDNEAGFLFFLGWMGTSVGALLVRRSRVGSLSLGCALVAIGALGLAFSMRITCFASMAIYGVGLGMAMTALALLQAARHSENRGRELNLLNLVWASGACAGPSLAAHSLRIASVRSIFACFSLFFAIFCLWVFATELEAPQSSFPHAAHRSRWALAPWPLAILLVVCLPTGIESSMGAWIASYVQRTHETIATTVTAGTCFWIGLLLSRTLSSFLLTLRRLEQIILYQSLVTVVAGAALLIATTATASILPGVFLIGFGLGPVYPLFIATALEYSDNTPIFFIAGLGSALLPWLTGIVSTSAHSLRIGLAVPLVASVCMLALGVRIAQLPRRAGSSGLPTAV